MAKKREGMRARTIEGCEALMEAMERLARRHRRSVNLEMVVALEEFVERHRAELTEENSPGKR
jgi:predicted transcriptional regulator